MKLLTVVKSSLDRTTKYIFRTEDNLIIEFSAIDKQDGKNIICAPCQTMCVMGCKFCHTTEHIGKLKCRNLTADEIVEGVTEVYKAAPEKDERVLLVSFMGCGEPLFNSNNVVEAMFQIKKLEEQGAARYVRFALATSLPEAEWLSFFWMAEMIKKLGLPVKLHLSLHYTMDALRKEWMPKSLDILPSLAAVDFYNKLTGNAVEIHYALLEGINDTEQDAILVSEFLKGRDVNVKFLFYNEKASLDVHASPKERLNTFRRYFEKYGIRHEYYTPPGLDVGASCGQFIMDLYYEYQEDAA